MGAFDVARKALDKVVPGQHLTKLPGPRVLIEDPGNHYETGSDGRQYLTSTFDAEDLAARLQKTVPTVAVAAHLRHYNLNEWDCLITDTPPTHMSTTRQPQRYSHDEPVYMRSWEQRYPAHLSLICVMSAGEFQILDAWPPNGEDQAEPPGVAIIRDPNTVGRHLRQIEGLPESLSTVVRQELLPVAKARPSHPSFRHWVHESSTADAERLALTPFLLGPDDVVLAGSYPRNEEASVWLLPADLPDAYPWVIEALRTWATLYPERFPALPDWHGLAEWRSAAETSIASERQRLTDHFRAQFEQFQQQVAALDERAGAAQQRADSYQRALLTEDGEPLVEAVACALAALGFHVVDMDQHWPEGDRREDLRIFDDADPEWVALVEVKGAKNGAKETEVQNFGRWAERFILDEQRAPSARWFVSNHQRGMDPSARQPPFGNKSAVIATFAQAGGTVIDTRALFDLVRIVEEAPNQASAARALLKSRPPVLVRVAAGDLASGQVPA